MRRVTQYPQATQFWKIASQSFFDVFFEQLNFDEIFRRNQIVIQSGKETLWEETTTTILLKHHLGQIPQDGNFGQNVALF